jgi:hypothetical protein
LSDPSPSARSLSGALKALQSTRELYSSPRASDSRGASIGGGGGGSGSKMMVMTQKQLRERGKSEEDFRSPEETAFSDLEKSMVMENEDEDMEENSRSSEATVE